MARKARRSDGPKPARFSWTRSNRNKLIACLDYSLQHKVDLYRTAIGHLSKTTGQEVTAAQIRKGLENEWKAYGRSGGKDDFETFLSEGSIFLVGYRERDYENFEQEMKQIAAPQSFDWLVDTPLKSASRSYTLSPNRCQRSDTSTLSLHATPEFEDLGDFAGQVDKTEDKTDEKPVTPVITQFTLL